MEWKICLLSIQPGMSPCHIGIGQRAKVYYTLTLLLWFLHFGYLCQWVRRFIPNKKTFNSKQIDSLFCQKGIAFGIARSSLHVPTQILAFGTALVGFSFAKLYGHSVPHFYAGNVHHSMGWFLFLILWAQVLVGVVRKIANAVARSRGDAHYERLETVHLVGRAESSNSCTSSHQQRSQNSEDTLNNDDDDEFQYDKDNIVMSPIELDEHEFQASFGEPEEKPTIVMRAFNIVKPFIPSFVKRAFVITAHNPFTVTVCRWAHLLTGRIFPLLIFIQTLSGMVVYAGVCR